MPKQDPSNILVEAEEITSGARNRAYGHPKENHENTAAFWTAYMKRKYGADAPTLSGRDVCLMMILLKISRDANKETRDNLVDAAGYARNAEMIDEMIGEEDQLKADQKTLKDFNDTPA